MSLLSAFNKQCKITPHHTAFIEGNRELSYQQVEHQTKQISQQLKNNISSCQRVAIALDRGIDAALTILSVLNTGCCYVPLDIKNPSTRLSFIVNDADVQCIIGKGECPAWLEHAELWLDIEQQPAATTTLQMVHSAIDEESLAAILYTSGSTGVPKGVALSHRAMKNFSNWAANTFNITDIDRIASLAPFHFDLSVFDIFSSLSQGASIHFIPAALTLSPTRLTTWLSDNKISTWYTVPSILNFISLKGSLDSTPLPHLKTILFAGEVFPTEQLIKLCKLLPQVNFYNLYGPTETNVCCYWPVDINQLQMEHQIPIGIPACDSKLKINPNNGELQVQSNNNLSGYWQHGRMIPALSIDNYYHTGDKVSLGKNSEYYFHGRLDRMLKCSGYRVEPAEIERIILQSPEVEYCAVVGIKDSTSGQRPASAVVLIDNSSLTDIIKPIKQKLPAYMQPCRFIELESLPTLSNGKIDYQSIQKQLENR